MAYSKKHVVDYCSACGVVQVSSTTRATPQVTYKRNVWVQKSVTHVVTTSAK